MIILGLTGSIGMGKSTTAAMFIDRGIPVHDADRAVHMLYENEAVLSIEAAFPGTTVSGHVDRALLGKALQNDPRGFPRLEAIVHPLVRAKEAAFLRQHRDAGAKLVVLDIPLLFETGAEDRVDAVVVATCALEIQRQRVLSRPGMTEEKFALILARQMPDSDKRARADFLIDTGLGLEAARRQVDDLVERLLARSVG